MLTIHYYIILIDNWHKFAIKASIHRFYKAIESIF